MRTILTNTTLMKSKRQPNNLKKLLTKAEFTDNEQQTPPTISKCNRPNCKLCLYIEEGTAVKFNNGKKVHNKNKYGLQCTKRHI